MKYSQRLGDTCRIFKSIGRKQLLALLTALLFAFPSHGGLFAQNITLHERNASLQKVLEGIKKQSGLDFLGDMSVFKSARNVSIRVDNAPIDVVLEQLSKGQNFDLYLSDGTILLKPKNAASITGRARVGDIQQQNQQYSLTGTVTDQNGKGLEGVTVRVVGSGNWASVSGSTGSFTIIVNKDDKLRFSMIGYHPVTIDVNGRQQLQAVLSEVQEALEETIVTAYSTFNRETYTGNATIIRKEDIQKMSTPNILTIIQTLDASFVLTENIAAGSNPNTVPEASMRGVGNITGASSNPLILLDGFPISMRELYDIDIERIESIHVLKDATATALYGSRGANGVIQVETSLPKEGKLAISYSMMPTANFVDLSSYNLLNAREKLEYEKLAGLYTLVPSGDHMFDYNNQVLLDNSYYQKMKDIEEGVDTYWLKQPIRNTLQTSHNLTIGGGANDVRYQLSASYADRMGTMKGSDRTTYGATFRLEYRLPNKFTFSNLASYSGSSGNNSPYGSFSTFTQLNPYWRVFDENGAYITRYENDVYNPLFLGTLNSKNNSKAQIIRNNLSLEWRPTQAWLLNASGSIEKTFNNSDIFVSPYHPQFMDVTELADRGRYTQGNSEAFNYEGRVSARYNRIIDRHIIAAQATGELRSVNQLGRSYVVTGFSTDAFIDPSLAIQYLEGSTPASTEENTRSLGMVGSVDYSYDQRYAMQASLRLDASSLYGKNERYQYFPSIGLRWNIHNEQFMQGIQEHFNRFSLRATYGVSSNQNFSSYQAISTYTYAGNYYYNTAVSNLRAYGNENLKWQNSKQLNLGAELEFLDRRLGVNVDYYNKMDDGMVISADTPPSLGFTNFLTNLGAVRNRGVEAELTVMPIRRQDFSVRIKLQAVRNKSALLNITDDYLDYLNIAANSAVYAPVTKYLVGESIHNLMAVRSLGIDPANGKEVFLTKDGQQTYMWDANDRVVVSDGEPTLRGNPSLDIFYKNFSLFVATTYSVGKGIYNSTLVNKVEGANPRQNVDKRVLEDRWHEPGDVTFYKDIKDRTTPMLSTRFLQKESFFNLSNITLRYNDRRDWIKKYKIVDLSYSISVNDLARFSNVERERGTTYPFEKSISGSLRVTF